MTRCQLLLLPLLLLPPPPPLPIPLQLLLLLPLLLPQWQRQLVCQLTCHHFHRPCWYRADSHPHPLVPSSFLSCWTELFDCRSRVSALVVKHCRLEA